MNKIQPLHDGHDSDDPAGGFCRRSDFRQPDHPELKCTIASESCDPRRRQGQGLAMVSCGVKDRKDLRRIHSLQRPQTRILCRRYYVEEFTDEKIRSRWHKFRKDGVCARCGKGYLEEIQGMGVSRNLISAVTNQCPDQYVNQAPPPACRIGSQSAGETHGYRLDRSFSLVRKTTSFGLFKEFMYSIARPSLVSTFRRSERAAEPEGRSKSLLSRSLR